MVENQVKTIAKDGHLPRGEFGFEKVGSPLEGIDLQFQ